MDIVETVARAISGQDGHGWAELPDNDRQRLYGGGKWHDEGRTKADYIDSARDAIKALRDTTLVYRNSGKVVHELRGAPDDIWKTLLDAALTPPLPLEGV